MPASSLRLFGGGIATETNVFSPLPTGLESFSVVHAGDSTGQLAKLLLGATFDRYREISESAGCTYAQGLFAYAPPAGLTTRVAYETLRHELLSNIEAALPLHGILLSLHGAMVAEGYGDCESDITQMVRQIVGLDATIGVFLDPHCDLPPELIAASDVIVTCKEYPHTDIEERAEELARLIVAAARREVTPTTATFDCKMIGLYPTQNQPMRAFVDRMKDEETRSEVLSISLGHGFPWGDAPASGARVLVVTDGDHAEAETTATRVGQEFFSLRHDINLRALPMVEAIDRALSARRSKGPAVLADISDNPGGGAPGDSTFILAELLARRAEGVALALLWDPVAVDQAFAAGEGASLSLRLGGKMGPTSGSPLDLRVVVSGLTQELVQRVPMNSTFIEVPCGRCARLTCNGIDIVVGSVRQQARSLEVFTSLGIKPEQRSLLVVKSTNHFQAAFAPIAADTIYADAPGALRLDPTGLPYRHVDRHKFPWVDDPWA